MSQYAVKSAVAMKVVEETEVLVMSVELVTVAVLKLVVIIASAAAPITWLQMYSA
jgi:hypothetical protein